MIIYNSLSVKYKDLHKRLLQRAKLSYKETRTIFLIYAH